MINQESNLIKIAPETQTMVPARVSNHTIVPSSLYDTAPESEHVAYLREFARSVRKHLWLVLGLVFCATAASIIYNARQPDIYEAKAQVRVDQENNPALNALGQNAPIILTSQGLDPQYFSTQLQILTGPSLMRSVVKALDLEHNPDFFRSVNQNRTITQSVARMFGLGKEDKTKADDRASAPVVVDSKATVAAPSTIEDTLQEARRLEPFVQTILGNLKVVQSRDTRIINISYTHQDPQVAAKIVNSIADIYVRSNFVNKGDNMNKEGEFLQQRIAQLQGELQRSNQQLNELAKQGNFLGLTSAQDVVVARLAALNNELIKAENDLRLAESQRKVGSEKPVSDAEIAKELQPMEEKLNTLNVERAKLSEIYTPEWQGIKQLDAQITEITKQIQETKTRRSSNTVTALDARYREAAQREQKLRVAFAQQKDLQTLQLQLQA